jgi:hypothetical protein
MRAGTEKGGGGRVEGGSREVAWREGGRLGARGRGFHVECG